MQQVRPYVLCISGFDSSGGAGMLADIKTLENLSVMGLGVLTANTLQTEDKIYHLDWLPLENIIVGIEKIMSRYPIDFVKIGIVPNSNYLDKIVHQILKINNRCKIIWDTVLSSTSGQDFFDTGQTTCLKAILPFLYLITPNIREYELLESYDLLDKTVLQNCAVLQKGGHRLPAVGLDILHCNGEQYLIKATRKVDYSKHGSGCVLSSAIVAYLATGFALKHACERAKDYIHNFLNSNSSLLGYHYEKNS